MPGMDRSGPLGLGPMTGRGLGMCVAGVNALRYGARAGRGLRRGLGIGAGPGLGMGPGLGLGFGRTLGRGLGCSLLLGAGMGYACMRGLRRNRNSDGRTEAELLQEQKQRLETRLEALNKQLEGLAGEDQ
jgi:hypothetical protein